MDILLSDLKQGFRRLTQSPGFTAAAVAALALGIGANTAIFSIVDTVLLKPLPYPQADRIVVLMNSSPQGSGPAASPTKYNIWRKQTQVLEEVAAYDTGGPGLNLSGGGRPEQVRGVHVSREFFPLFGATTVLGRTFTPEEDRPGGGRVVVLSNGLWQRRFGGDPTIVGRALVLGGEPYTVIGVLDSHFSFDTPADVYLPFQADPNSTNQGHFFRVAARLKAGVSLASAKAAMALAAEEFRRTFPGAIGPQNSFTVEPMRQLMVRNVQTALYVLLGVVACVLLIACANVANLLLARATGRSREMAIRAAIGAGRARIIRQLLTESVLLSLIGGAAGLALGAAGVHALLAINSGHLPRIGENGAAVGLDGTVLAFTLLVSLGTGVLFGLAPALDAVRGDLNSTLRQSSSRSGSSLRQNKLRGALVVTEIALAMLLLTGAGLLIRNFAALSGVAPGFDSHNVLTMDTALTGSRYDHTAEIWGMSRQVLQRVDAIPGVEESAASSYLPLEGGLGLGFIIEGRPLTNGPVHGGAGWNYVTSAFFSVFRLPVTRGRVFTERDDAAAPPVVVINEAMARRFWKDQNPIGQRLIIGSGMGPDFVQPPREIIGVVGDARDAGLNADPQPETFIPLAQVGDAYMKLNNRFMPLTWLVRTKVAPFSLAAPIQQAFEEGASLPVAHVRSMDQIVVTSTSSDRFNTLILAIFAFVAVLLASVGLYGLISYSVEQRTVEFGIRLALGSDLGALRNMVMRQAMTLAAIGIAIGTGAAWLLTKLLAGMLYTVKTHDPAIFGSVAAVLALVALLASYLPAQRALRVDPAVALRWE